MSALVVGGPAWKVGFWPEAATWALPQIGSYLGYSECGASLSGRAEPVTQRGHPQI
jgi:hypothetical protein